MSSLQFSHKLFTHIAQSINVRPQSLLNRAGVTFLGSNEFPNTADFKRLRPVLRTAIIALSSSIGLILALTVVAIVWTGLSTMAFEVFAVHASVPSGSEARAHRNFESILQRPLFSRNRQAALTVAVSAPAQPPVSRAQNLLLKGVFINGTSSKAFLTSEQYPLGTWVENKEEISGWRVVAVRPDQVVLHAENDEMIIGLGSPSGSGKASETPPLPHRGMALPIGGPHYGILGQPRTISRAPPNVKAASGVVK